MNEVDSTRRRFYSTYAELDHNTKVFTNERSLLRFTFVKAFTQILVK